jgi:hypothetical protein
MYISFGTGTVTALVVMALVNIVNGRDLWDISPRKIDAAVAAARLRGLWGGATARASTAQPTAIADPRSKTQRIASNMLEV